MPTRLSPSIMTAVFLASLNSCIQVKWNAETLPAKVERAAPGALVIVAVQKKTGQVLKFPRARAGDGRRGQCLRPGAGARPRWTSS